MTSQPVAQPFPDVDDLSLNFDCEDDVALVRGIVVAIALCVPFWAVVYWIYRSVA